MDMMPQLENLGDGIITHLDLIKKAAGLQHCYFLSSIVASGKQWPQKKRRTRNTCLFLSLLSCIGRIVASELNGFKAFEVPVKGLPNENNKEKLKDANGDSKHV
ncbi:hypothetical protein Patl1_37507 [Pistacia atlantica]|nr:hypothetical protein Patl1_37507 [Pistacia atlantica]